MGLDSVMSLTYTVPMSEYTINAPAEFQGTDVEKGQNFQSHTWSGDEDIRCAICDCRPGGRAAEWPCGADVPRVEVSWARTLNLPTGPVFVYGDRLKPAS